MTFFKPLFLFYVYGCFTCMYVCVPCLCHDQRSSKRASDPLRLELQTVRSCNLGAGKALLLIDEPSLQQQKVTLKSQSSCLLFPSARFIGMCYHAIVYALRGIEPGTSSMARRHFTIYLTCLLSCEIFWSCFRIHWIKWFLGKAVFHIEKEWHLSQRMSMEGAEGVGLHLKTLAALTEDLSSIPSTRVGQLSHWLNHVFFVFWVCFVLFDFCFGFSR